MTMVGSDGWCVCATQENLIAYAQGYSDEFADGHPAVVKPEDRQWSYDPAFPLAEMVVCSAFESGPATALEFGPF